MSNEVLVPLLIIGFIIVFSAMWLGITGLLGKVSGWSGLERAFPDHPEPPVETLGFQTARMRGVNFNNCLKFEICVTGLRVSLLRLLGPFRKPFFVPWGQISAQPGPQLVFKLVELKLGEGGEGAMLIRERTFERLAAVGNLRID